MKARAIITVMACFVFLMIAAGQAKADTTVNFTVTITSGTESGDIFTGSYAYDSSNQMTSFAFSDPNWDSSSFTNNSDPAWNNTGQGYAYYQLTNPSDWMVWFNKNTQTQDDSFAFGSANLLPNQFVYGTSTGCGADCFYIDGSGTVSYSSTATPEPGTMMLLGTGLFGLLGLMRRRQKA